MAWIIQGRCLTLCIFYFWVYPTAFSLINEWTCSFCTLFNIKMTLSSSITCILINLSAKNRVKTQSQRPVWMLEHIALMLLSLSSTALSSLKVGMYILRAESVQNKNQHTDITPVLFAWHLLKHWDFFFPPANIFIASLLCFLTLFI